MFRLQISASKAKSLILAFFTLGGVTLGFGTFSAAPLSTSDPDKVPCRTAEQCFTSALEGINKRDGTSVQPTDPRNRLLRVQALFPGTPWEKMAGVHLGLIMTEDSPEEAVRYFQIALKDFPILEDYIRLWMGKAQLNAGHIQEAAKLFERVLDKDLDSILKPSALYLTGQAWYEGDECEPAIQRFRQAIKADPESSTAPGALLKIGECAIRLHKTGAASEALRELWWRFPTEPETQKAKAILERPNFIGRAKPTLDQQFKRAMVLYKLAQFEQAVSELESFLTKSAKGSKYFEAQYKLGVALNTPQTL